jgi:hypothetical protein
MLLTVLALGLIVTYILNPKTSNDALIKQNEKYSKELYKYVDESTTHLYDKVNERIIENEAYTDELREYIDSRP